MYLTHALRAIVRAVVASGDALWKYVTLLVSGTPSVRTFISDASSTNAALTINGDVRPNNFSPYTLGYYSNYFDGSGDGLSFGANANFSFGTGDFTVEFWTNPPILLSSSNSAPTMVAVHDNASDSGWQLYLNDGAIGIRTYYSNVLQGFADMNPLKNKWSHIAYVRYNGVQKIYIDGVERCSTSTVWNWTNNTLQVGYTAQDYPGYISNLRMIKGTALYTSAFTPPTAPLTAISGTVVLTCQSNRFLDNGPSGVPVTRVGGPTVSGLQPFTPLPASSTLGSAYFDGTGDYLTCAGLPTFGTSDFTIEGWVYPSTVDNNGIFQLSTSTFGGTSGLALAFYTASGGINTYYAGTTGGGNITIAPNTWYHFALSRSGTSLKVFINGVVINTFTDATNYALTTLTIGGYYSSSYLLTGNVSNFRIVKGTALYTSNFVPPAIPLTATAGTTLLTLQTDQSATNKQFVDNSSNNLLVTQAGNATQGSFSPYGANWSVQTTNGGNLSVPANTALRLTGDFTIECWIYPLIVSNSIIVGSDGGTSSDFFGISSNIVQIGINNAAFPTWSYTFTRNTWYHIALTRSSNTLRAFVNGTQLTLASGSATNSATMFQAVALLIGKYGYTSSPAPFDGYISDLRIIKGTALYTASFTPPTAPLTAVTNTVLLTCQSNRYVDNSINNFTVNVTGTPKIQEFSPYSPAIQTPISYSTYFDGTGDYLDISTNSAFGFGTGDFTIEFWAYSTVNARQDWIDISDGTNRVLFYYSGTAVTFYGNGVTAITGAALTLNTWVHYALVKSSGSTKLYVNGTQAGSTYATNQNYGTTSATTVGKDAFGSTYITGYMSNLRIVKGTAVYTTNFTPATIPLTAISGTSLLTCQSATIVDNSSNAFAITTNGDARARSQNPFGFTNTTGQSYTPALYGASAYCDATATIYSNTVSPISGTTADWTMETWCYFSAITVNTWILGLGTNTGGTTPYVELRITGSGTSILLSESSTSTSIWTISSAYTFTTNQWYHLAGTRSGSTLRLFVNGVQVATGSHASAIQSGLKPYAAGLLFGSGGARTDGVNGFVSDARMLCGTALYTGGFVPPVAPLQAIKNTVFLLNMDKAGVVDSSRTNDSTTTGDAKIRYETPYAGSYYSNYFDGSGDTLNLASSAALLGSGNYTVEFWVNLPAAPSGGAYFTAFAYGSSGSVLRCFLLDSGGTYLGIWIGAGNVVNVATTAMVGKWAHIAICRNGTSMTTYVNGVSVSATTDSTNFNTGQLYIASQSATNFLTGFISNFRIVTGTAVYTSAFTPPTAPLTAISGTSLLTCQSKAFTDNSTNNLTITKTGDVAVRSFNPFQAPSYSSMYFDGGSDDQAYAQNVTRLGTGSYTYEMWLYSLDDASRHVFSFPGSWSPSNGISMIQYGGNYALSSGTGWAPANALNTLRACRTGGSRDRTCGTGNGRSWTSWTSYRSTGRTSWAVTSQLTN